MQKSPTLFMAFPLTCDVRDFQIIMNLMATVWKRNSQVLESGNRYVDVEYCNCFSLFKILISLHVWSAMYSHFLLLLSSLLAAFAHTVPTVLQRLCCQGNVSCQQNGMVSIIFLWNRKHDAVSFMKKHLTVN